MRVLAGQDAETGRPPPQEFDRLRAVGAAILYADDVGMVREFEHGLVLEIDRRAIGNVVERDRPGGVVGERA